MVHRSLGIRKSRLTARSSFSHAQPYRHLDIHRRSCVVDKVGFRYPAAITNRLLRRGKNRRFLILDEEHKKLRRLGIAGIATHRMNIIG